MLIALEITLTFVAWTLLAFVTALAIGRVIACADEREGCNDEHSEFLGIGGAFHFHAAPNAANSE